jgi:hypothetical protein
MSKNNDIIYSDYWLDDVFDENQQPTSGINTNLIRLASSRRLISNFVNILINKNIPVSFFCNRDSNANFTDGERIWLSADIEERKDFDVAVGLSLHEGSHILLTDFALGKQIWQKAPRELYDLAEPKFLSNDVVHDLLKMMFNYVEDRYIDNFIYKTSPGYRGYYLSLYNKYFNNEVIGKTLKSSEYRSLDINSYTFRIINLTNPDTDLTALPGLKEIYAILDLNNIGRLKQCIDRYNLATTLTEIVIKNLESVRRPPKLPPEIPEEIKEDGIDNSDSKEADKNNGEEKEDSKGTPKNKENKEKVEKGDEKPSPPKLADTNIEKAERAFRKQKDFLGGSIRKKEVKSKDKKLLDIIEENDISTATVGKNFQNMDKYGNVTSTVPVGIECIVVKKLTKELIVHETFPMVIKNELSPSGVLIEESVNFAVKRGIVLGNLLGHRLQIRNEENFTKFIRRTEGKLERRTLYELGWDSDTIFSTANVDKFKKIYIHISVDGSSSMKGNKWARTMTAVVAICKATSMIDNIETSVSFRTTTMSVNSGPTQNLPYIILAYDSSKDKFAKVANLFPYLQPAGYTPEGLAYEAVIANITKPNPDSVHYFINFSDGEPCLTCNSSNAVILHYNGMAAAIHTQKQVNKIRMSGYDIISYFIKDTHIDEFDEPTAIRKQFKKMYGENASFINIENIVEIAKSLNGLFLKKDL